ncbi:MAG: PilZ domain-containing protein [Deltaproteobacteria bacterium]|nr:PilZ domain-containing protein [Deltaproteobacteria bacterium]
MKDNDKHIQEERRKSPRSDIQIWAVERSGNSTSFHLLKNLSTNGFFIEKRLPFPIGTVVHLELELGPEKIPVKGEVIDNYKDPAANYSGAGVRFIDMDENVNRIISTYLKNL